MKGIIRINGEREKWWSRFEFPRDMSRHIAWLNKIDLVEEISKLKWRKKDMPLKYKIQSIKLFRGIKCFTNKNCIGVENLYSFLLGSCLWCLNNMRCILEFLSTL